MINIAERLADLSARMQSRDNNEVKAAALALREVVISLEPVRFASDALALQCVAMDIARLISEGTLGTPPDPNVVALMRCAMVRAAYFLEASSGDAIADWSFLPERGQTVLRN